MHEIAYVKNKREKISKCNLCLQVKPMSWDHVPPKGGIELTKVEMQNILDKMSQSNNVKSRESQDGLKYRTICSECNNKMGIYFDPALNNFAIDISRFLKSSLILPDIVNYRTKPAKLIRGILGHIIAAKIDHDNALLDKRVRDFIFEFDKPVHPEINIYYWLYPYSDTVVMRDFVRYSENLKEPIGFCNLIKYFPIAYLVTDQPTYGNLFSLTKWSKLSLEEEVEIPINLENIKPYYWPENPQGDTIGIFGGKTTSGAIRAVPRKPKLKSIF